MGRHARYSSPAERQKAFRERRKAERTQPRPAPAPGEVVVSAAHAALLLEMIAEAGDELLGYMRPGDFIWPDQRQKAVKLDDLAAALGGQPQQVERLRVLEGE